MRLRTAVIAASIAILAHRSSAEGLEPAGCSLRYEVTDLGTLGGGPLTQASAVSNQGSVVGYSEARVPEGEKVKAFRWRGGVMRGLGPRALGGSTGRDVNERDEVAGL